MSEVKPNGNGRITATHAFIMALAGLVLATAAPFVNSYMEVSRDREQRDAQWAREDVVALAAQAASDAIIAASEVTNAGVEQVHKIVNSGATDQLKARLQTTRMLRASQLELIDLKRASGQQPKQDTLDELANATQTITDLEKELVEKIAAAKLADEQMQKQNSTKGRP